MTDREKMICAIERAKRQSEEYAQDRILVPFREADMIISLLREQESVVHCKDCIYRPTAVEWKHGTDYVFPYEGKCPCQCDDDWYSWMPDDDWFCANGERAVKQNEAD